MFHSGARPTAPSRPWRRTARAHPTQPWRLRTNRLCLPLVAMGASPSVAGSLILRERRLRALPRVLTLPLAGVAFWGLYALASGPSMSGDSESYAGFAHALSWGTVPTSERTLGYPLLIALCEYVGRKLHLRTYTVTIAVQVILLAGASTALLYDIAHRLTASRFVATVAAALFLTDADIQNMSVWIMSEPLSIFLVLLALWLRLVDDGWRRAGWALACLVLTRPLYLFAVPLFAALEGLRQRSWRACAATAAPTLLLVALSSLISWAWSARSTEPVAVFLPRHSFGRIYEFDLWTHIPDSPQRRLIAELKANHADPYGALDRLTLEFGPRAWLDVQRDVLRATPLAFLASIARAVPRAFRQAVLWKPARETALFRAVVAWHAVFWGVLFWPPPMLLVFAALVSTAAATGFGSGDVARFYTWVGAPFAAGVFMSVALLAMGTDSVGRLALGFRPIYFLAVALCAKRVVDAVGTRR
jgi:hypothetical protein